MHLFIYRSRLKGHLAANVHRTLKGETIMFHCPLYNSYNACATFSDCVFLRESGCAIVLSADAFVKEEEKLKEIEQKLSWIENTLQALLDKLR